MKYFYRIVDGLIVGKSASKIRVLEGEQLLHLSDEFELGGSYIDGNYTSPSGEEVFTDD